jgi:hypothetical protein
MLEHKHGPFHIQNFVPGNIAANTVLFRYYNNTDNPIYITEVRFIQSVGNNNPQTFTLQVLSEDLTSTISSASISFPASTRVLRFSPSSPIRVRPREVINIFVPAVSGTVPANVLTSVRIG